MGTHPTDTTAIETTSEISRAKQNVATRSVLAAAVITALKLVTGLFTGSIGMLSEAAHSSVDLIASSITWFAVRESDKPADDDHTYGHGKLENLSAFIESLIMLGSCVWIIVVAAGRIFNQTSGGRERVLHITAWPFAVLLLSMVVDFLRSRALKRVAESADSQALAADALHFRTDLWSSLAVLAGLSACWLGERMQIPWLQLADPIAALLVAAIILRVTFRLIRETVDVLLDAAPRQTRGDLVDALNEIPDVLDIERVRLRRAGNLYFADLVLGLERNLTFQRTQQVVDEATAAVHAVLPGADVVVNTVPVAGTTESIFDRVRAVAARSNLAIHDVTVRNTNGKLCVEQHIEVNETMPLREAHDMVTRVEAEMLREVPEIDSILTHIESEPATIARSDAARGEHDRVLEESLRRVAKAFPEIIDVHDVQITYTREGTQADHIQVTCHCTLPDNLPMSQVHTVITQLENAFIADSPQVQHMLIHPEPVTDNRR